MERRRPGAIDFSGPLWECLDRWNTTRQAVGVRTQSLFEAWLKCRTADLEQGMRFYREMMSCRDPVAMLQLQQRWLLGSASRLHAEFQELGGKVATLTTPGITPAVAESETPPAAERDAAE
jgi:hypothetical protein